MSEVSTALRDKAPLRPIQSPPSLCMACGTCSSACPLTGVDGFDPRRVVRLALLGRDEDIVNSRWPWLCTMCGKCEHACPMGVNIVQLMRTARGMVPRENVPGQIHKGVALALETGNNLGLPDEDFRFILEDVAEEMKEEEGFENFELPLDAEGARVLTTLHNKLVNTQNEDLVHWWKIFHAAKERFTIPVRNWEGVNWALFSGDDASMKIMIDRIAENMERLNATGLMYPE